jgi:DNA repair ATPase RecN
MPQSPVTRVLDGFEATAKLVEALDRRIDGVENRERDDARALAELSQSLRDLKGSVDRMREDQRGMQALGDRLARLETRVDTIAAELGEIRRDRKHEAREVSGRWWKWLLGALGAATAALIGYLANR